MQKQLLSEKLRKAMAQLPYLPRALKLVWQATPRWALAWVILLIFQGILPVATVYLTKAIVDSMVLVIDSGGSEETITPAILYIGLMALVLLITEILRSLTRWVRTALTEEVKDYLSNIIHEQATRLDMAYFETPEYYDRLHRSLNEARYRPVSLLENIGVVFQNSLTMVAMFGVLATFSIWLPLVLFVSALPIFAVLMLYTLRQYQWRMRTTSAERRSWYYNHVLTDRETAAELRLFNLSDHFKSAYQTIRTRLRHEQLALLKSQGILELVAGVFSLLILASVLVWMLMQAIAGRFTLGDLALFYQAFNQGQKLMRALMENMSQIYSNSLFLGDLFEFLALDPIVHDPQRPLSPPKKIKQGIILHNVTFQYPDSHRIALNNFSLELPAGKVVAIVGSNGAGKSTLIKLLCRFYDPVDGKITLDGQDLRDFAVSDLQRLITIMFQEPVHYNTTAAQNIALGDLNAEPTQEKIEWAAQAAGADTPILRLSKGYETLLGRWFGGAEMSVGEWQRVSLARAFLRRAELIILDEPTSAMDSWAEADWLNRFRDLTDGRSAVIITHRFTTAMRADMIHVMDQGKIIESGTHDELLKRNGRYAESWRAQTEKHPLIDTGELPQI